MVQFSMSYESYDYKQNAQQNACHLEENKQTDKRKTILRNYSELKAAIESHEIYVVICGLTVSDIDREHPRLFTSANSLFRIYQLSKQLLHLS